MSIDVRDMLSAGVDLDALMRVADTQAAEPAGQDAQAQLAEHGQRLIEELLDQCRLAENNGQRAELIAEMAADESARRVLNALHATAWPKLAGPMSRLRQYRGLASAVNVLEQALAADRQAQDAAPEDDRTPAHWPDALRCKNGRPHKTLRNLALIFELDPHWEGAIRWNEHAYRVEVRGEPVEDHHESRARVWVDRAYGIDMPTARVSEALRVVARRHAYHPVRDYLDSLTWDGGERIAKLGLHYLGGNDHPVVEAISKRWFISAVARIYEPGCKVDTVLVLQGPQGAGKSTAIRVLASPAWFSDTAVDLQSKDVFQQLTGVWLYEMAEMTGLSRADVNRVKGFTSSPVDRLRLPYGRNLVELPRQCVFVATTNDGAFLTDPTGARRFWPLEVRKAKVDALRHDRDQLWAEAVRYYKAGEQWHLTDNEDRMLRRSHRRYQQEDPVELVLEAYLSERQHLTEGLSYTEDICKELDDHGCRRSDANVTNCLKRLGWSSERTMFRGRRCRRWVYVGG